MEAVDLLRLMTARRAELERLYRDSPAGAIPGGRGHGRVLLGAGEGANRAAALYVRHLLWQGKVFDPQRGELRNLIAPLGLAAIVARVYAGASWADGKPCIVLDYSQTSLLARWVRDELRLVAPDLYLGVAYLGPVLVLYFALDFAANGVDLVGVRGRAAAGSVRNSAGFVRRDHTGLVSAAS